MKGKRREEIKTGFTCQVGRGGIEHVNPTVLVRRVTCDGDPGKEVKPEPHKPFNSLQLE